MGRITQGLAGSGAWIVGFATLADITDDDNMGRVMGIAMSFVMAGIISGPMVAGGLLQLFGYWQAWSARAAVLVLDILARLVMIEVPQIPQSISLNDSSEEMTAFLPASSSQHCYAWPMVCPPSCASKVNREAKA